MNPITVARARAFKDWPYLAMPLSQVALIAKPGLGTMAVSVKWQVFYDPDVVTKWGTEASAAVLCHEVWHLIRRHAARRGDRDAKLWNIACDIAINDDPMLSRMLPDGGVRWSDFTHMGLSPNMLEEDIYDRLVKHAPPPGGGGGGGGGGVPKDDDGKPHGNGAGDGKCGSGSGGEPAPCEDDGDMEGCGGAIPSDYEAEGMAKAVAEAVRSCGNAPGSVRRWADSMLAPPTVDWRKALRVAVTRQVRMTRGATDYSYQRSRVVMGVVTPGLYRPTCPVAIVLDTSGSVSGPLLDAALAEVDGILKATSLPCTVLACDTQVHGGAQKVTRASAVQPLGGGGTDMGKGIRAADALRPKHGAIIVLTDGYTPWPTDPPRSGQCIVALIGSDDGTASRVPAWATVIRVS
jgi:predicted metal-dependent peptidase